MNQEFLRSIEEAPVQAIKLLMDGLSLSQENKICRIFHGTVRKVRS